MDPFTLLIQGGAVGALVLVAGGFVSRVVVSGTEVKEANARAEQGVQTMTKDRDYWRDKYDRLWDEYVQLSQIANQGLDSAQKVMTIKRRAAG